MMCLADLTKLTKQLHGHILHSVESSIYLVKVVSCTNVLYGTTICYPIKVSSLLVSGWPHAEVRMSAKGNNISMDCYLSFQVVSISTFFVLSTSVLPEQRMGSTF